MVIRDDYDTVRGTFPPDVLMDDGHKPERDRMHGLMDRVIDPLQRLECRECRLRLAREMAEELDDYRQYGGGD